MIGQVLFAIGVICLLLIGLSITILVIGTAKWDIDDIDDIKDVEDEEER